MEDRDVAYEIGEELTREDLSADLEICDELLKEINEALYMLSGSCKRAVKHLMAADAAVREARACVQDEM